jgi:hypothetical protein
MFDIPYPKRRGSLHDQIFKDLLGTFLPELVILVAPELAARLHLTPWILLNKETFTDWPKGKRREVDLLASVALADGSERTALIHVEIEARYRPEIGRRLNGYYMQIRLRHNLPVLPIALCLRGGPPGISLGSVLDADLGTTIGHFRYYLFCLERSRAEDFLARDQPLGWALAALMRSETLSRAEHKMACLRRIAAAPLDDLHRFLLVNFVETYLQLTGRDAEELAALQARGNAEEVRSMGTRRLTWAEQFEEKGWKKGVETGWNKGMEKGMEKGVEVGMEKGVEVGVRQMLLRQLGARFGPLSDEVKQRVEAIHSLERLNQIAEHLLVARSLEEMDLR